MQKNLSKITFYTTDKAISVQQVQYVIIYTVLFVTM